MFRIRYRMGETPEALGYMIGDTLEDKLDHGIEGYIEITFGAQYVGFWSDDEVTEYCGLEYIDFWFDCLLDVLLQLQNNHAYAAFRLIETTDFWLEFAKEGNIVFVNQAHETAQWVHPSAFIIKPPANFMREYSAEAVGFEELKQSILFSATDFLRKMEGLSEEVKSLPYVRRIAMKIARLTE